MKTLKEIHAEIMAFLPAEAFLIIQHDFRNYSSMGDGENWGCQVYASDEQPLDSMFMIHRATGPEDLIASAKLAADAYRPNVQNKIEQLKQQIAKLEASVQPR